MPATKESRKGMKLNDDDWPGRGGFSVWMSQTHITENLYMTG